MAFEIFDDVAFYYMATSVISIFLFPLLALKLYRLSIHLRSRSASTNTPTTLLSAKRKVAPPPPRPTLSSLLTLSNVSLLLLLLTFVFLLAQLSSYNAQPLTSYDAFAVLGLTSSATPSEIKRAYRTLVLKWHPDKNVDNAEEATRQFIAIEKAYNSLTSPEARENIERYGNPDGPQAVSVSIGLPSFLTKRENEMRVLLLYFLLFFVLPPVAVYVWWQRAKDFADNGVMVETLRYYQGLTLENYGPRFLIETLAMSQENEKAISPPLASHPHFYADYVKLYGVVKESMVKQRLFDVAALKDPSKSKLHPRFRYVHPCSVVLHAHMQRVPIAESLQPLLHHLLKQAHPLLNCMLDVCVSPQPVLVNGERKMAPSNKLIPALGTVDLMQMITQAMWVHDSPLKQLPHIDDDAIKSLHKKNIRSVHAVRKMDAEKRAKVLPDLTPAQWEEIDAVCSLMPNVTMEVEAGVEDEEDVFEGDIVRVRVGLQRLEEDGEGAEVKGREQLDGTGDEEKGGGGGGGDKVGPLKKERGTGEEKEDSAAASVPSSSTKIIDDSALTEEELADLVPIAPTKKTQATEGVAPLVHAPYFPYEKREKWMAILVEMDPIDRTRSRAIVAFARVPTLVDRQSVDLRFQAPPVEGAGGKGWQERVYQLHVLCDSYAGVDRGQQVMLKVKKVKKEEKEGEEESKEEPVKHEKSFFEKLLLPDPDEVYESKWSTDSCTPLKHLTSSLTPVAHHLSHLPLPLSVRCDGRRYYLGCASFWELALNAVVLTLLGVFLFNFLHSRGYWQWYVEPVLDVLVRTVQPVTDVIKPVLVPVVMPVVTPVMGVLGSVYAWLHRQLHVEPLPPLKRKKGKGGRADRIPTEEDEEDEEVQARRREREERTKGEQIPGLGEEDEVIE